MQKVSAIIVAAGSGRRYGGLKQFETLNNKPVYLWSADTFRQIKSVIEIILVVPKNMVKKIQRQDKRLKVVVGGRERFNSVKRAIKSLSPDAELILIHDAVRPLISAKIATESISAAAKYGGSIVAIPASDTVKFSQDGKFVKQTIPRNSVFLAQTPQVFQRQLLEKVYAKNKSIGKKATDDSYLAEKLGIRVKIVRGEAKNLKITTKDDLKFLESLLKQKPLPLIARGFPPRHDSFIS